MQIFVLAGSPEASARNLCDQHVGVQIKELAQMLSTVAKVRGVWRYEMYKPTHENHSCIRWLLFESGAIEWALRYADVLECRYQNAYQKYHGSSVVLNYFRGWYRDSQPAYFVQGWGAGIPYEKRLMTTSVAVWEYRKYYIQKLTTWAQRGKKITWTGVPRPEWINVGTEV